MSVIVFIKRLEFAATESGMGRQYHGFDYGCNPYGRNGEERYGDPVSYGRGAGRILQRDGRLYRPIQGNFEHYVESVIYNEITELSESRFDETEYCRIAGRNIHHLDLTEGLLVIDANSEKCNPFFEREEAPP